jgi:hypothetical protein
VSNTGLYCWSSVYLQEEDLNMEGLRHASEADDLYCIPSVEVRLPKGSWSKSRVVPLGDLAYSQTAGGFGVKWGLIGPYILAGEVATLHEKDNLSCTAAVVQGAKTMKKF